MFATVDFKDASCPWGFECILPSRTELKTFFLDKVSIIEFVH